MDCSEQSAVRDRFQWTVVSSQQLGIAVPVDCSEQSAVRDRFQWIVVSSQQLGIGSSGL